MHFCADLAKYLSAQKFPKKVIRKNEKHVSVKSCAFRGDKIKAKIVILCDRLMTGFDMKVFIEMEDKEAMSLGF
jgi:hypothetical protein